MTKIWLAISAVAGAVLLVVLLNQAKQTGFPANVENAEKGAPSLTSALTSAPSSPVASVLNSAFQQPAAAKSPAAIQIGILSPLGSEKWAIGDLHAISWSKEAGVTGQVYLVSAATGGIAGWIHSETSAHQTSFNWPTRDVATNRYGNFRKDLSPGNYFIEVKFDNQKIAPMRSRVFSIVHPDDIKAIVYTVIISNSTAAPSSLSLKKGDRLVLVNNDQIALTLSMTSRGAVTIQPGQRETLDMATFPAGTYDFYSEKYPSLKLRVEVR